MTAAGSELGHLLLVGDPGAALGVAAGITCDPQADLSVSDASVAALDRLREAGQPLVMVDVPIDLEEVLARLRAGRADMPEGELPECDRLVGRTMADVERALILQTLVRCRGNRTSASRMLGISVRTMRNKLRSFIEDGVEVAPAPAP